MLSTVRTTMSQMRISFLWDVAVHHWVSSSWPFWTNLSTLKGDNTMFLQNSGYHVHGGALSYLRRMQSSTTLLWKCQHSQCHTYLRTSVSHTTALSQMWEVHHKLSDTYNVTNKTIFKKLWFSQWFYWRIQYFVMWFCVIKRAAKDSSATLFRVQVTLNMEALPSFKMPGTTSQTTQHHISEYCHLQDCLHSPSLSLNKRRN